MKTTDEKRLKIILTDRTPVSIVAEDWPIVAKASGDSWGSGDSAQYDQAKHRGELDEYVVTVRKHNKDGRWLVYGKFTVATFTTTTEPEHDRAGGRLLGAKDVDGDFGRSNVVAAICSVGEACHIPYNIIRECIADLPAEEI